MNVKHVTSIAIASLLTLGLVTGCGGGTETKPDGGEGASTPAETTTPSTLESPAAGEKSPAAGEKSPAAGEKSPAAGEKSPAAGEKSPAAGEKSPAAGEKSPAETKSP